MVGPVFIVEKHGSAFGIDDQYVEAAVAVVVAHRGSAAHDLPGDVWAGLRGEVGKAAAAQVAKQVCRFWVGPGRIEKAELAVNFAVEEHNVQQAIVVDVKQICAER